MPKVEKLDLRHAGQLKDSVLDYIIERKAPLRSLRLDAANLISDAKWREFFDAAGAQLESVELSWLDFAFDEETARRMILGCPNLRHLKMKKCFHLGNNALDIFALTKRLESISLNFMTPTISDNLMNLIMSTGARLEKLSLSRFQDADDSLLEAIHQTCMKLTKLAFTGNDRCTDAGFAALFNQWKNPPLTVANLSSNRDVETGDPDEQDEEPVGFASNGFTALMRHSGQRLKKLNISSCRHISTESLSEVFDAKKQYSMLKDIDLSFVSQVDTTIIAGIFNSCPALQKVAAFGCFDVRDVIVPPGVALIGVPTAQDSIVQDGGISSLNLDDLV